MKLVIVDSMSQLNPATQASIRTTSATSMLYINYHNEKVMVVTGGYLKSLKNRKWACGVIFSSIEFTTSDIEIKDVQYLVARTRGLNVEWTTELLEDALLVLTPSFIRYDNKMFNVPQAVSKAEILFRELEFVLDQQYDELDVEYWEKL